MYSSRKLARKTKEKISKGDKVIINPSGLYTEVPKNNGKIEAVVLDIPWVNKLSVAIDGYISAEVYSCYCVKVKG